MYKQNIEKHIELSYPAEGVSVSRYVCFFIVSFTYLSELIFIFAVDIHRLCERASSRGASAERGGGGNFTSE